MNHTFDDIIKFALALEWPEFPLGEVRGLELIRAQMQAESSFDPKAKSKCGACGLMQLMPATFEDIWRGRAGTGDIWLPEHNIRAGIAYDRQQYEHFPEIPEVVERVKFSLAAYNGGRGYVNKALDLARRAEGCENSSQAGRWQLWESAKTYLAVEGCVVGGKRPDYRQMWNYVDRIMALWVGNGA